MQLKIKTKDEYKEDFKKYFPKKDSKKIEFIFILFMKLYYPQTRRKIISLELAVSVEDDTVLILTSNEELYQKNNIQTFQKNNCTKMNQTILLILHYGTLVIIKFS